jgi:hypothetical protein
LKHLPLLALNAGAEPGKPFSHPGAASAASIINKRSTATTVTSLYRYTPMTLMLALFSGISQGKTITFFLSFFFILRAILSKLGLTGFIF